MFFLFCVNTGAVTRNPLQTPTATIKTTATPGRVPNAPVTFATQHPPEGGGCERPLRPVTLALRGGPHSPSAATQGRLKPVCSRQTHRPQQRQQQEQKNRRLSECESLRYQAPRWRYRLRIFSARSTGDVVELKSNPPTETVSFAASPLKPERPSSNCVELEVCT